MSENTTKTSDLIWDSRNSDEPRTEQLAPTPRCNAEQARVPVSDPTGLVPWVALSFAQQLEQELATERAAREAAEKKADYLANALQGSAYQAKDFVELSQRAETVEAQLQIAREALEHYQTTATVKLVQTDSGIVFETDYAIAQAALAQITDGKEVK